MDSVLFPGAVNSKFTNELKFQRPQDLPAIPTYRLIDTHGEVVDKSREPDVSLDLALKMYKDMVTSRLSLWFRGGGLNWIGKQVLTVMRV